MTLYGGGIRFMMLGYVTAGGLTKTSKVNAMGSFQRRNMWLISIYLYLLFLNLSNLLSYHNIHIIVSWNS